MEQFRPRDLCSGKWTPHELPNGHCRLKFALKRNWSFALSNTEQSLTYRSTLDQGNIPLVISTFHDWTFTMVKRTLYGNYQEIGEITTISIRYLSLVSLPLLPRTRVTRFRVSQSSYSFNFREFQRGTDACVFTMSLCDLYTWLSLSFITRPAN